jgi:hypothetical protein
MEQRILAVLHWGAATSRTTWESLKPWAERNVTFSLLLAILTEVPRWTFAFSAINEPLWAGVPLAILIAFAAAHAWEEFFFKYDWLLLLLNTISLLFAVITIAPVLYAMIDHQAHEISISLIFNTWQKWIWATILSCTTFLPLIQLAVVEARRRERLQVGVMLRVVEPQAKPARPALADKPQPASAEVASDEVAKPDIAKSDLQARAQAMRDANKKLDEIAAELGKSASWVSRNTMAPA